jgi:hypothetical protein
MFWFRIAFVERRRPALGIPPGHCYPQPAGTYKSRCRSRQWRERTNLFNINHKDVIDDCVFGPFRTEEVQFGDSRLQKTPARFAVNAGHHDQTGMYRLARDQLAEVAGVLGHDDAVFSDAAGKNDGVVLAAAPNMQRVDGLMLTALMQAGRDLWRKALVDEEPDAALRSQGLPPGRPTNGCVRA